MFIYLGASPQVFHPTAQREVALHNRFHVGENYAVVESLMPLLLCRGGLVDTHPRIMARNPSRSGPAPSAELAPQSGNRSIDQLHERKMNTKQLYATSHAFSMEQ